MPPSATEPPPQASTLESTVPPPHLYTPREGRFENFIRPQADGYRQAKLRGTQRAAIVIDNGQPFTFPPYTVAADMNHRLFRNPSRMVVRLRATTKSSAHILQVSRPETRQDVLVRRGRCLCRHNGAGTHEKCFRGWQWHCE